MRAAREEGVAVHVMQLVAEGDVVRSADGAWGEEGEARKGDEEEKEGEARKGDEDEKEGEGGKQGEGGEECEAAEEIGEGEEDRTTRRKPRLLTSAARLQRGSSKRWARRTRLVTSGWRVPGSLRL